MKDDLIRRQTAITAIQKAYADTEGGADRCAVWKNVGLTNALHIMQDLPSAQPEHLVNESGNLVKGLVNDCISRQAAIDAVKQHMNNVSGGNDEYYIAHRHIIELLRIVPSVQPQRMSDDETCDSCRYRYNEWDEDPCDGCTPADSGYCPDSIELQPPISKREWYQKGYEAGLKSVQPQKMRGKWNVYYHGEENGKSIFSYSCNQCGYGAPYNFIGGVCEQKKWNFCPNCGADMRETE